MKTKILSAILTLLTLSGFTQYKPVNNDKTIIEGYFTDGRADTVRCTLFEEMLGTFGIGGKVYETIAVNGHFKIEVPLKKELAYIHLISSMAPSLFLYEYIIRRGDSNYIKINTEVTAKNRRFDNKGLQFSGRNCHSFQVRYCTDSAVIADSNNTRHYTLDYRDLKKDINVLWDGFYKNIDYDLSRKLSILGQYKNLTTPLIYELLRSDMFYSMERWKVAVFATEWIHSYKLPDSVSRRESMLNYFTENFIPVEKKFIASQMVLEISKSYLDFLFYRNYIESAVLQNRIRPASYFSMIPIINRTSPALRERLLTFSYIMNLKNSGEFSDSLGRYALSNITNPYLHTIVDTYYSISKKGMDSYAFSLENDKGKLVKLSDLKGKTVFIDFWFTGCTACISVASSLKQVKANFINDTSMAFVSISTDKEKDRWLASVKSGKYTDNESINLYTNGLGETHEIITYNQITGYPKLLLIDKRGKIFSFTPPRPDGEDGVDKLTKMIQEAKGQ